MEDFKKETRNVTFPVRLARNEESESRTVEGYAMLFDTPSDGLWFDEVIERGALDGVIAKSDVLAVLNHSVARGVLARSRNGEGSLHLEIDDKGLLYRFEAPRTALGDELLENLRRGEICESSFCFTVESDTWIYGEERDSRTIHKISELFDVSPVYNGAYSATTVYTRGRDEMHEAMEQKNKVNLESYLEELRKQINL